MTASNVPASSSSKPSPQITTSRRPRAAFHEEARKSQPWEIPISMIDIIFQLLIFFMLTASFPKQEKIQRIDLPDIGPGNPGEIPPDKDIVMVHLLYSTRPCADVPHAGLRVLVNNKDVGNRIGDLLPLLKQLALIGKHPVQLFASKNCPYYNVAAAIDMCKMVKFDDIRFTLPVLASGGGSSLYHLE